MAFTVRSYSSNGSSTSSTEESLSCGGTLVRSLTLVRRPAPAKLGFSIRGGREHGTGFFVTAVEQNSEAAKQGLVVGDQILRVNGFPVEDATHKEVLQLILGQHSVSLKVKSVGMIPVKENPEDELSWQIVEPSLVHSDLCKNDLCEDVAYSQNHTSPEVRMVIKIPPRAKLGCGICKGPEWKPGVFVQFTKENSIARNAGLRPGDQIVQCNNFTFTPETPFSEAVSVMRCSGVLELVVKKGAGFELFPGESSGYNSSASSVAGDPPTLKLSTAEENHEAMNGNGLCSGGGGDSNNNTGSTDLAEASPENGSMSLCRPLRTAEYSNGCTVIHVGCDETDNGKKLAEICMVSQQLETKTTTVLVEVHQSEEDSASHSQSDSSTDRFTNSSSVSSFTSSASSLSSAISQELERRSKRQSSDQPGHRHAEKQTDKLIKSGLAREKVQQHEQLMQEFKKAHRKMFSGSDVDKKLEERVENKTTDPQQLEHKSTPNGVTNGSKCNSVETFRSNGVNDVVDRAKIKRQSAPPPPPPLPSIVDELKKAPVTSAVTSPPPPPPPSSSSSSQSRGHQLTVIPPPPPPLSVKKYPAPSPPSPPSPPQCPTPDYDTLSLASDTVNRPLKKPVNGFRRTAADIVEMQSLESFKLTNPSKVEPKPPSTYFSSNCVNRAGTNGEGPAKASKPIVTIREYPGGKERKNPAKFDFLQNIAPPPLDDQPIGSRFQHELSQTLSRATTLTKNETHTNTCPPSAPCKATVVTITSSNDQEHQKPFYLFPNGVATNNNNAHESRKLSTLMQVAAAAAASAASSDHHHQSSSSTSSRSSCSVDSVNGCTTRNSVTFNFSNTSSHHEVRNHVNIVQPSGILKNSNHNVSHVQIHSHMNIDKVAQQKSIKFG